MSKELFDNTNYFVITKKSGEVKKVNFDVNWVTLYFKLYNIKRKSDKFYMKSASVLSQSGRLMMNGHFDDIFYSLIEVISTKYKFMITGLNSEGGQVHHWRDTEAEVLEQLERMKVKYIEENDGRAQRLVYVTNLEDNKVIQNHIFDMVYHFDKIVNVPSNLFDTRHSFEITHKVTGIKDVFTFQCLDLVAIYNHIRQFNSRDYYVGSCAITHKREVLATGWDLIMSKLIHTLDEQYRYTITVPTKDERVQKYWKQDMTGVLCMLASIKDAKFPKHLVRSGVISIFDNHKDCGASGLLEDQIKFVQKEMGLLVDVETVVPSRLDEPVVPDVQSVPKQDTEAFGVYLSFEEVLNEMRPLITNGTDKEKIEAKAILAYVALKMAGN